MPLPEPISGEDMSSFISRFMSNPIAIKEFPSAEQRYAVARSKWLSK